MGNIIGNYSGLHVIVESVRERELVWWDLALCYLSLCFCILILSAAFVSLCSIKNTATFLLGDMFKQHSTDKANMLTFK